MASFLKVELAQDDDHAEAVGQVFEIPMAMADGMRPQVGHNGREDKVRVVRVNGMDFPVVVVRVKLLVMRNVIVEAGLIMLVDVWKPDSERFFNSKGQIWS